MATAFILINCELGAEDNLIKSLNAIETVTQVCGVFGAYDLVVKAESESNEKLQETITWKIRKLPKIRCTLTLNTIKS